MLFCLAISQMDPLYKQLVGRDFEMRVAELIEVK